MRTSVVSVLAPTLVALCCGCMEVSVRPGNYAIKQGESVKVDMAVTQGVVPKTIGIQKKPSATEWADLTPMEPNDGGYMYTFEDVQDSFEYKLNVSAEGTGPFFDRCYAKVYRV